MADLYFKVRADYDELIRMQDEAERLKKALSDFSGAKGEFSALTRQLEEVNNKIAELAEKAANSYMQSFTSLDTFQPNFMKSLTSEAETFASNMVLYFSRIQQAYASMLDELDKKAEALNGLGVVQSQDVNQVEDLKRSIVELRSEVQSCFDAASAGGDVWKGAFDASAPESVKQALDGIAELKRQEAQANEQVAQSNESLATSNEAVVETSRRIGEEATQSFENQKTKVEEAKEKIDALQRSIADVTYNPESLAEKIDAITRLSTVIQELKSFDGMVDVMTQAANPMASVISGMVSSTTKLAEDSIQRLRDEIKSMFGGVIDTSEIDAIIDKIQGAARALEEAKQGQVDGGNEVNDGKATAIQKELEAWQEELNLAVQEGKEKVLETIQAKKDELDVEKEKLEVLRQQAEEKKKQADELKPNFIERASAAVTGFLGMDVSSPKAEAQAKLTEEAEKASEALRAQEAVVNQLEQDYERMNGSLSESVQRLQENAEATRRKTEEEEAYKQEVRESAQEAMKTDKALEGVMARGSQALKAVSIANLRQEFQQAQEVLQKTESELTKAYNSYNNAVKELRKVNEEMNNGDATPQKAEKAIEKVETQKQAVMSLAQQYEQAKEKVDAINVRIDEMTGKQQSLRSEMGQAMEDLARMVEAGKAGTPEFMAMAQEAGKLQRSFKMASASMQYFANPQRHLATLKTGLQGVAGATGLVTGAMGLFNSESKKMQEIQTKIQSVMAIVVGLETTYNAIKKTSNLMLAIQEVRTSLLAKAKKAEAVATEEAAVAQEALNGKMVTAPYGAMIAVIGVLAGAVVALISAFSSSKEEMEENKKRADELTEAYDYMQSKNQEVIRQTTNTIVDEREAFRKLKKSYLEAKAANKDMNKWVEEAKNKHQSLGLEINNVTDAEYAYVKGTDNVLNAMEARAKYAAALAVQIEILKDLERAEAGLAPNPVKARDINTTKKIKETIGDKWVYEKFGDEYLRARLEFGEKVGDEDFALPEYFVEKVTKEYNKYLAEKQVEFSKEALKESEKRVKELEKQAKEAQAKTVVNDHPIVQSHDNQTDGVKPKEPKKKREKKEKQHQNDEWSLREEELKNQIEAEEKKLKLEREYANRVEKAEIDLMNEGYAKRKRQLDLNAKKEREDIEERYRQLTLAEIEAEKSEFDKAEDAILKKDAKHKKAHYYESAMYKAHFDEAGNLRYDEDLLNKRELEYYLAETKARQENIKLMEDYMKDVEKYFGKDLAIRKKYQAERDKIRDIYAVGGLSDEAKKTMEDDINRREAAEMKKLELEEFKDSALFASVMGGDQLDRETVENFKTKIEKLMSTAAQEMSPTDFKAFSEVYEKFADRLIEEDPFGVLRVSIEDYKKAQQDLTDAKALRESVKAKYEDTGVLEEQKEARDKAFEAVKAIDDMLAKGTRTDASGKEEKLDEEDITQLKKKREEATKKLNEAEQTYLKTQREIKKAEDNVKNAETEVANKRKQISKALKQSAQYVKELSDAFAGLAENVSQPFADAISGVGGLITSTLNGIDVIEKASKAAQEGIMTTAQAVESAVAILAIIQAAWQVINTIIGLFSGGDEEKYHKYIDSLHGKVDALDYTFNRLKEDMDEAWGTEAINAYTKAVNTLVEKQAASLELIKAQSRAHFGHHSLEYYQKKESGITSKELEDAKKKIQELGGDTSGEWITDWLYTLTAEQLREFMASGIGTLIMGKLRGVSGTGDYSGSDWARDMEAYADTAQSLEDLADEMAEKLNGISFDGLKDEFKSLVTTFTTSFNDINKSFDAFMREGIYNMMRSGWEDQLEDFYDELSSLKEKYDQGKISEEEFRQGVQALRNRYQQEIKKAQDDYQSTLTASGINVTDVEQSATSGGFEAMSEDTATELNGRFAAMQAMETVTAESAMQLVGIQTNITNIADEIRTVQVNSYLELQAISENTKKIYNTVGEMQENVKQIKENTDRL